jgi:hypothetical protein
MATIAQRPELAPLPQNTLQRVCRLAGWVMTVVGILGFAAPLLFGMHLGFVHSLLYLVVGGYALWYGQNTTERRAVRFSLASGALLALAGIAGLVLGRYGISSMGNTTDTVADPFLVAVVPGWLEFGRADHIVHLLLGTVLLLSGVLWEGRELQREATDEEHAAT